MRNKLLLLAAAMLLFVSCNKSDGDVDALSGKIDTIIKTTIPGLQTQIDLLSNTENTLRSDLTIVQSKLNNDETTLNSLKSQLSTATTNISTIQQSISTLQKSIEKLQDQSEQVTYLLNRVVDLSNRMSAVEKLDLANFKKLTNETLETMSQTIETLAKDSDLQDLKGKFETLSNDYELYKQNLTQQLKSYVTIAALNDSLQNSASVKAIKSDITTLQGSMREAVNSITELSKDGGIIDSKIAAVVDTQLKALGTKVETIEKEIGKLKERVVSVVFVPDYLDGLMTIESLNVGELTLGSTLVAKYRVYPASAASDLAANPNRLSFDVVKVGTRATVPSATITSASANDGLLALTASMNDVDLTNEHYSIALKISNTDNTVYSTAYTGVNSVSGSKSVFLKILDANGKAYTDQTRVSELSFLEEQTAYALPGHQLMAQIEGTSTYMTYGALQALYPSLPDYEVVCEKTADPKSAIDYQFDETKQLGSATVNASSVGDASIIGSTATLTYTYSVKGYSSTSTTENATIKFVEPSSYPTVIQYTASGDFDIAALNSFMGLAGTGTEAVNLKCIKAYDTAANQGQLKFYYVDENSKGVLNVTLQTIPQSAFDGKTQLTGITLPSTVTTINERAFYGVTGLTSITLPATVTSIASSSFQNCSGLTTVTLLPTTPPTLGLNVFADCNEALKFKVPEGTVESYKTNASWVTYKDRIE